MACSIHANTNILVLQEEPSKHKDEAIGSLTLDVFAGDICGRSVSFHSGNGKESLDDAMEEARLPLQEWSAMLNTTITRSAREKRLSERSLGVDDQQGRRG